MCNDCLFDLLREGDERQKRRVIKLRHKTPKKLMAALRSLKRANHLQAYCVQNSLHSILIEALPEHRYWVKFMRKKGDTIEEFYSRCIRETQANAILTFYLRPRLIPHFRIYHVFGGEGWHIERQYNAR